MKILLPVPIWHRVIKSKCGKGTHHIELIGYIYLVPSVNVTGVYNCVWVDDVRGLLDI